MSNPSKTTSQQDSATNQLFHNRFSLAGKASVVTGATGILGAHFCRALASAGASVFAIDLAEEPLQVLMREIREEYGVKTGYAATSVCDPKAVHAAIDLAVETLGRIDILHNNAATKTADLAAYFEACENYSSATWEEVMNVNINGMFYVAQAVGKKMIAGGRGGSIVQTSSIYGIMAPDQRIYEGSEYLGRQINTAPVYTTSKHAVIGLTKHLATLWAPHGIRVNAIALGGVASGQNNEFAKKYSARVPLARMANPEDITPALVYLASDASLYMTGQTLVLDGGLSAW